MTGMVRSSRRWGPAFRLALVCAVAVTSAARADEASICDDPRITVEGRVDARWLAPLARACERSRSSTDSDPTARVRVLAAGTDLILEVELEDGRSALRRVRQVERLGPTLEALLLLPPKVAAAVPVGPAPAEAAPPAAAPPSPSAATTTPLPPSPEPRPPPLALGVEIGGGLGVRVAGREAYLSLAPALFAHLRIGSWLIGLGARWEVFQSRVSLPAPGFEMETLGMGLSLARRFRPSFGTFDVGVEPRLLSETQSYLAKGGEIADSQTDVRMGVFARLAVGDASLRFFTDLDFELSPGRIRRDIRIDAALPPLPSWSAGLAAGVVWGEP